MSLSISPSIAFMPSVFYDRNHNPLNIPCEGPKVVPMFLVPQTSDDGNFVLDFTQLFTSGQLTCLQSMTLDISGLVTTGTIKTEFAGTGQIISFIVANSTFGTLLPSTQTVPISCLNPPKIKIDLSMFHDSGNNKLGIQFYNYQHPVFNTYTINGGAA